MISVLIVDAIPQRAAGLAVLLRLQGHDARTTRETTCERLIARSPRREVVLVRAPTVEDQWIVRMLWPEGASDDSAQVINAALASLRPTPVVALATPSSAMAAAPGAHAVWKLVTNPVHASRSPFTGRRRILRATPLATR